MFTLKRYTQVQDRLFVFPCFSQHQYQTCLQNIHRTTVVCIHFFGIAIAIACIPACTNEHYTVLPYQFNHSNVMQHMFINRQYELNVAMTRWFASMAALCRSYLGSHSLLTWNCARNWDTKGKHGVHGDCQGLSLRCKNSSAMVSHVPVRLGSIGTWGCYHGTVTLHGAPPTWPIRPMPPT